MSTKSRRRKNHPKADIIAELMALSIDELHADRIVTVRRLNGIHEETTILQHRLASIKHVLSVKKGQGGIGISDHAVLRYLERKKGVDVAAARVEISELAKQRKLAEADDQLVQLDDGFIAVANSQVATTYLTREMVEARSAPLSPPDIPLKKQARDPKECLRAFQVLKDGFSPS